MPRLQVRGLSVRFGGLTALSEIDLDVAPAEIRGIIGPNGAGKTTLVNLISGLGQPSAGEIRLDGASLRGMSAHKVAARGLRRTFQTTQLFAGMSVLENVMTGCHARLRSGVLSAALLLPRLRREEREAAHAARAALDFVGMAAFAERDGGELSYGQQRMVEIARALVGEPRVLLLDEPAVGLSPERVQDLDVLIRRIRDERGVTIVMIEHVIRLVMDLCDRITVLASGRKIAEGGAEEVAQDALVQEAYLGTVA